MNKTPWLVLLLALVAVCGGALLWIGEGGEPPAVPGAWVEDEVEVPEAIGYSESGRARGKIIIEVADGTDSPGVATAQQPY